MAWIDAGAYSYHNSDELRYEREAFRLEREEAEEAAEREAEAVAKAHDEDTRWRRLASAGYTVTYEYDGDTAWFHAAAKVVRSATRVARRDHRDGRIKAGQRYAEATVRVVDADGNARHEVHKQAIG